MCNKRSGFQGMFSSRGSQLLMVDADGATRFSDLTKVQNALHKLMNGKVCPIYCIPFLAVNENIFSNFYM